MGDLNSAPECDWIKMLLYISDTPYNDNMNPLSLADTGIVRVNPNAVLTWTWTSWDPTSCRLGRHLASSEGMPTDTHA